MNVRKGPGAPVQERISGAAARVIIAEIEASGGNEVFFVGRLDEDGLVGEVRALARGHDGAVPALASGAEAGDVVIHNHPTGMLVPSDADLDVASNLGSRGVGFYIVDNRCLRVYAVTEPRSPGEGPEPLDPDEVERFLGPHGPLAAAHPNYEDRPSQCRMARDVAGILDSGAVGVLEAGTGTGKSLAYLVPAALWAMRGNRRVTVATRTINLQEQILTRDLPLLEEALGAPVKAALVKGRGNYCCLRKRDMLEGDGGGILLDFDDLREVRQLMDWTRTTADGSLADLPFIPSEANWSLLKAESDSCMRARCSHFGECFFYRARLEAASAHILLANHHLLFADLGLRDEGGDAAAIMPRYEAVIMDEAHNVEDVALSYFDVGVSRQSLMGHLGRLVSRRRAERGLVPFLRQKVQNLSGLGKGAREALTGRLRELGDEVARVRQGLDTLLDELAGSLVSWLGDGSSGSRSGPGPQERAPEADTFREQSQADGETGGDIRWRLPLGRRNEPQWTRVRDLVEEMVSLIVSVLTPLRKVNGLLREAMEDGFDDFEHVWSDLAAVFSRLDSSAAFLRRVLEGETLEEVFWVEVRSRGGRSQVALHLTPLNVSPILQQTLFSRVPSVVFTSATLTVAGSFHFFDARLGIEALEEGRRVLHEVYPTPFDLPTQMRLAVIETLPDPGRPGFVDALSQAVGEVVLSAGGGGLILFTSYSALTRVFERCRQPLADAGIPAMRQGEAPRSVLLERFRYDPDSVLFATDSFWEGVDVVGSSLRLVLLARLPFPVPTDPVNEARSEAMVRQGMDPFFEDSVPRAVIRMRQGVGRLIRHRNDRGYVVICDGRIVRRPYGRIFLESLGEIPVGRSTVGDLTRDIRLFLETGHR
ncbi:MAG: helicase [bacterium]|nr:MAG: helicase [bacterium]